jgi:hypothetical protein
MTRIIAEDGSPVAPGSGIIGRIARAGPVPLGYYKDPEKTARTFITIGGLRHVLPGDYGTIEADGTIKLLGRGNMVINSGGEKIFVEEIEEALKKHPAIDDALVFGMADPVWGQAVTAVVEANAPVTTEALRGFLGESLARYKLPKAICFVEKVPRGPNAMFLKGGCLCGQLRYAAEAEPLMTLLCHCKNCQKQSGGAFSVNICIPMAALTFHGTLKTYEDHGDSGNMVLRRFCPDCGSPIMSEIAASPGLAILKAGSLDDTVDVNPAMEFFCDSAQLWVERGDKRKKLARQ